MTPVVRTKFIKYHHQSVEMDHRSKETLGQIAGRIIDMKLEEARTNGEMIAEVSLVLIDG